MRIAQHDTLWAFQGAGNIPRSPGIDPCTGCQTALHIGKGSKAYRRALHLHLHLPSMVLINLMNVLQLSNTSSRCPQQPRLPNQSCQLLAGVTEARNARRSSGMTDATGRLLLDDGDDSLNLSDLQVPRYLHFCCFA